MYRAVATVRSSGGSEVYTVSYVRTPVFNITSVTAAPAAPVLSSAVFANDGSYVQVTLDSSAQLNATSSTSSFLCSAVFSFPNANISNCQWTSSAQQAIRIYPGYFATSSSSSRRLSVSDSITLLANKLRALCTVSNCVTTWGSAWVYASRQSVTVSAPSSPVTPSVLINAPTVIGQCDSLTIDVTGSTGSGGRSWASISFAVFSSTSGVNASVLLAYLNQHYVISPPAAVPYSVITHGAYYTINVKLCNFLGTCGQGSFSFTALNSLLPSVTIFGPTSQEITRSSSLTLSSNAFIASCDGSASYQNLLYTWAVYNSATGSSVAVTSTATKDKTKFGFSSYALTSLATYTVELTVFGTSISRSASTSVQVFVSQGSIVAGIRGSSSRSLRVGSTSSIDASISVDEDVNYAAGGTASLSYSWSCVETSPSYSYSCAIDFMASLARVVQAVDTVTASLVYVTPNAASIGTSSAVTVTVYDSTRASTASVTIHAVAVNSPLVSISSSFTSDINVGSNTIIKASYNMTQTGVCTWSMSSGVISESLSEIVLNNALSVSSSGPSVAPFNLVIGANELPTGITITFTLSCSYSSVGSSSLASSAVTITTNVPPVPGKFAVSPSSGTELQTVFTLSSGSFTSDNLPLSYQFGYYQSVGSSGNTVQLIIQSPSMITYATSMLPGGSSSSSYALTCVGTVIDTLSANTTLTTITTVRPSNASSSQQAAQMRNILSSSAGNTGKTKQAMSTISSTMNNKNCTAAPDCTSLNRHKCGNTPNTCGSCIGNSYAGDSGDSNNPCILKSRHRRLAVASLMSTACTSSSDCGEYEYCDSSSAICAAVQKSCPSDCSSHGSCAYFSLKRSGSSSRFISSCNLTDSSCSPVCICDSNYFESDCSVSLEDLLNKQSIRTALATSLISVIDSEDVDSDNINNWASNLRSITSASLELNDDSMNSTMQAVEYIIIEAIAGGYSASNFDVDSNADILVVLDQLASALVTSNSSNVSPVAFNLDDDSSGQYFYSRSEGATYAMRVVELLAIVQESQLQTLVVGQSDQFISESTYQSDYKAIESTSSASGTLLSMGVPVTTADALQGVNVAYEASVLTSLLTSDGSDYYMSLTRLKRDLFASSVYDSYDTSKYAVFLASDVMQLLVTGANFSWTDTVGITSEDVLVSAVFPTDSRLAEDFSYWEAHSNYSLALINNVTRCSRNQARTVTIDCSEVDEQITFDCTGTSEYDVYWVCPSIKIEPACVSVNSDGSDVNCTVTRNSANSSFTCDCRQLLTSDRRRATSSTSGQTLNLAIIGKYTTSQAQIIYRSIISEDPATHDGKSSLLQSVLVGVLGPLFAITLICICMYRRHNRRLKRLEKSKVGMVQAGDARKTQEMAVVDISDEEFGKIAAIPVSPDKGPDAGFTDGQKGAEGWDHTAIVVASSPSDQGEVLLGSDESPHRTPARPSHLPPLEQRPHSHLLPQEFGKHRVDSLKGTSRSTVDRERHSDTHSDVEIDIEDVYESASVPDTNLVSLSNTPNSFKWQANEMHEKSPYTPRALIKKSLQSLRNLGSSSPKSSSNRVGTEDYDVFRDGAKGADVVAGSNPMSSATSNKRALRRLAKGTKGANANSSAASSSQVKGYYDNDEDMLEISLDEDFNISVSAATARKHRHKIDKKSKKDAGGAPGVKAWSSNKSIKALDDSEAKPSSPQKPVPQADDHRKAASKASRDDDDDSDGKGRDNDDYEDIVYDDDDDGAGGRIETEIHIGANDNDDVVGDRDSDSSSHYESSDDDDRVGKKKKKNIKPADLLSRREKSFTGKAILLSDDEDESTDESSEGEKAAGADKTHRQVSMHTNSSPLRGRRMHPHKQSLANASETLVVEQFTPLAPTTPKALIKLTPLPKTPKAPEMGPPSGDAAPSGSGQSSLAARRKQALKNLRVETAEADPNSPLALANPASVPAPLALKSPVTPLSPSGAEKGLASSRPSPRRIYKSPGEASGSSAAANHGDVDISDEVVNKLRIQRQQSSNQKSSNMSIYSDMEDDQTSAAVRVANRTPLVPSAPTEANESPLKAARLVRNKYKEASLSLENPAEMTSSAVSSSAAPSVPQAAQQSPRAVNLAGLRTPKAPATPQTPSDRLAGIVRHISRRGSDNNADAEIELDIAVADVDLNDHSGITGNARRASGFALSKTPSRRLISHNEFSNKKRSAARGSGPAGSHTEDDDIESIAVDDSEEY
jgi:hypothetical protein